MPSIEELENPKNKFSTEVISADGVVIGRYFQSTDNRENIEYDSISEYVIHALIATEDVRFSNHSGIDVKALFRACVKRGMFQQKSAGGASTITQQLAKLLYSPKADNIYERMLQKPIEWVIAVELEHCYTKEEILKMYLNKFDFLYNAVGIGSATKIYFKKRPSQLTIEEAALLVGMCKNPSYYNPVLHPERAKERRNMVIELLHKNTNLTKKTADSLKALPITLNFNQENHRTGIATYFREQLRLMLTASKPDKSRYPSWMREQYMLDSLEWEENPLYGWCKKNKKANGENYNLYTDGLKIYTTIDSRMQTIAESVTREHVFGYLQPLFYKEKANRKYAPFSKDLTQEEIDFIFKRAMKNSDRYKIAIKNQKSNLEIEKEFSTPVAMRIFTLNGERDTIMSPKDSILHYKYFLRCGMMAMDPHTGYVRAYVGGLDYNHFQYDMVHTGRRQVGSTIKPFLYTMAMENGFSPTDETENVPQQLETETGTIWSPHNSSKSRIGERVSLYWGLANSNNWISAYLMKQLNPYLFVRLLHSFGLKGRIDPVVSLCLGPCEVSVEEMTSAYSTFANKGVRVSPLYVSRIEDNHGNILAEFITKRNEVISAERADQMVGMLRRVVDGGTAGRLRFTYKLKSEIGGKTGTTQNHSDGWFMGITPNLVVGIWVGGEDRTIRFDRMATGQGASTALPIYGLFMNKVYANPKIGVLASDKFKLGENDTDIEGIPMDFQNRDIEEE
ncbi:MAG TPA: penicillin-binding protein [Porphyromonadaceae bacterium]|nr:penicillin-binding protein [Porphyromonadaceae bacterium]